MTNCMRLFAAVVGTILFGIGTASAQSLSVRQPTVAGGGGTDTAGQFELSATIAEPAKSRLTAGPFALYSGFQASIDVSPRPAVMFRDGFEPMAPPPIAPPHSP